MANRIVYLHGFASGPTSRKARFFAERLSEIGRPLEAPDLTEGNFERVTISSQLNLLERRLAGEPATLIGSSLGGYMAALYASRHPEITRLILLAPAFGFTNYWQRSLTAEDLKQWRSTGFLTVYHHGEREMRRLGYGIVEDGPHWPEAPAFSQPAHIFHGVNDIVVPASLSEAYAAQHPHVKLTLLNSDHELTGALDDIWAGCAQELLAAI